METEIETPEDGTTKGETDGSTNEEITSSQEGVEEGDARDGSDRGQGLQRGRGGDHADSARVPAKEGGTELQVLGDEEPEDENRLVHRPGPVHRRGLRESEGLDIVQGEWIKGIRASLDCSQVELSRLLGCSPMTVSRWERGLSDPDTYNQQMLVAFVTAAANEPHVGYYARNAMAQHGPIHALYLLLHCAIGEGVSETEAKEGAS